MNVAIKTALQAAVEHKAICKVKLQSEPNSRNLHPYGLIQKADGQYLLVCWQEEGHSKSGKLPNYRNLPISDLSSLEITTTSFDVDKSFNPQHKMYKGWEFFAAKS